MNPLMCALSGLLMAAALAAPALAANKTITAHFEAHVPGSAVGVDHAAWDAFLKTYVRPGPDGIARVDYGGVSADDRKALEAYLVMLTKTDVAALDRAEQFAYWVNLYNALTVRIVLDAYPVKSIRQIKLGRIVAIGPWGQPIVTVDGQDLSLDNIEHDILRAIWRDPRIHYAVNCASFGCPNLATDAFVPANADALLESGARAYVNHPRGARFEDGKLKVSTLYKWYKEDFGGNDAGVIAHLKAYADADLNAQLDGAAAIDGYDYDWSLNDVAK